MDDPAFTSALTVPHLAFAEPGTAPGKAGRADLLLRTAEADPVMTAFSAERISAGLAVLVAVVENGQALSAGQHQPVGAVSEIVGVGTLPAERRRGLAAAVTAALIADARERGIETVFLSANDPDTARIYSRLGLRTMGTALIAEPADEG